MIMNLAEFVRVFGDNSFLVLLVLLTTYNLDRRYWHKLSWSLCSSLSGPAWEDSHTPAGANDWNYAFGSTHRQQVLQDKYSRLLGGGLPLRIFPEEAYQVGALGSNHFDHILVHYTQTSAPPSIMIKGQYENILSSFCDYLRFEAAALISQKSFDALLEDRTINGRVVHFQGSKFPELHALIRRALPADPCQSISRKKLKKDVLQQVDEIRRLVKRIHPSLTDAPGVSFEDAFFCIALHFEPDANVQGQHLPALTRRHQLSIGQLAAERGLLYTLQSGWDLTHSIDLFRCIVAAPQYPDTGIADIIRSDILQAHPYWPHIIAILAPQRLEALIESALIPNGAFRSFHRLDQIFASFSLSDELLGQEDKEVTLLGAALLARKTESVGVGAILAQLAKLKDVFDTGSIDACWRDSKDSSTVTFIPALCQRSQHFSADTIQDLVSSYAQSGFFSAELAKTTPSFFYQILRARAADLFVALMAEDGIVFDPSEAEDLDACALILAKNHLLSPKLALISNIYQRGQEY